MIRHISRTRGVGYALISRVGNMKAGRREVLGVEIVIGALTEGCLPSAPFLDP